MAAPVPGWVTLLLVGAVFLVMALWESARPLRRRVEPRARHTARNLAAAGISLAAVTALQIPILLPVSAWALRHRVGLLALAALPPGARVVLGVLLLDYTLWIWHWSNHKVPFLWRFHLVHHVDRDLDASTGLRFHFGELGLSVFYRSLQIVAIGADPLSLWVWQSLLFACILFHHSNTRLPIRVERLLVRVFVTPRMHGIHHSDYRNETNSNWSSLLSTWDYLHGTILLDVPQPAVTIGVPAYANEERVTLPRILALPFRERGDDWARRTGGPADRPHDPERKARLSE